MFPVEFGLCFGRANAAKGIAVGKPADFGEFARELEGLIALPPLLPPPVQGDRDEDSIAVVVETFVFFERFLHEACEIPGEEELPPVFHRVDKMKGRFKTFEGGSCKIKIVGAAEAILTTKGLVEVSIEGLATIPAEGFTDSGKMICAVGAQGAALCEGGPAKFTEGGIEEVEKAGTKVPRGFFPWPYQEI